MRYFLPLVLFLSGCSVTIESPFLKRSGLTSEERESIEKILNSQQKQLDSIGKAVLKLQKNEL